LGYTEAVTEDRIKQRLTGAAIVVALLVLLVPQMFRGRPAGSPPANDEASGPPVRSYTIDLGDGGAKSDGATPPAAEPGLLSAPESSPTPPPLSTAAEIAEVPATPPAEAPVTPPAPATAAETPAATGSYEIQLGLFSNRANAARLAAKVAQQGVKVSVSGPDARRLYRVHTSAHASREEALAIQQKLRAQGHNTVLTPLR
jgi:DedD protein